MGAWMTSPVDLESIDATVYVDCLGRQVDLVEVVAEILGGDTDLSTARAERSAVLVEANEDADPESASDWPEGFLYFSQVMEVYAVADTPRHERAAVTGRLLSELWARGIAAVAACDYEDLLPAAAGTGDRSLPWPVPSPDSARGPRY